jgi:siroheme synthase
VLHQDDKPGWRIHLTPNGVDGGHSVSIKEAEELARSATDITGSATDDNATTPYMVVRNGTTVLRTALETELADAETKAASIAALRRSLAEMDV